MVSISEKLRQARLATNLTQEDLAEKLGVSRQTISNWENGRSYPDIVSIITLSDVYNMTLDSLLKGDKDMIKHLKVSTDTVKSNKRLIIGLAAFGFFCVAGFFIRDFKPGLRTDNLIMNSLTLVGLLAATFAVYTKSIELIESAELKHYNKPLTAIGVTLLNALVYAALIIYIPEFARTLFQIETDWIIVAIRVVLAGALLVPAFAIYKKVRCLTSNE